MQFHSPRCYCAHVNNDWMTKLAAASPEKKLRVSSCVMYVYVFPHIIYVPIHIQSVTT